MPIFPPEEVRQFREVTDEYSQIRMARIAGILGPDAVAEHLELLEIEDAANLAAATDETVSALLAQQEDAALAEQTDELTDTTAFQVNLLELMGTFDTTVAGLVAPAPYRSLLVNRHSIDLTRFHNTGAVADRTELRADAVSETELAVVKTRLSVVPLRREPQQVIGRDRLAILNVMGQLAAVNARLR